MSGNEEKNASFHEGKTVYLACPNICLGQKEAEESAFQRYGDSVVNEGESFMFKQGKWTDWSKVLADMGKDRPDAMDNFSIKAYTVDA